MSESGLANVTANWVRANTHQLEQLPEPGSVWTASEAGFRTPLINQLKVKGIIERVGSTKSQRGRYKTKKKAFEGVVYFLERARESDGLLPCGHDGFVNQGGVLECKRCGTEHDRSEVDA